MAVTKYLVDSCDVGSSKQAKRARLLLLALWHDADVHMEPLVHTQQNKASADVPSHAAIALIAYP